MKPLDGSNNIVSIAASLIAILWTHGTITSGIGVIAFIPSQGMIGNMAYATQVTSGVRSLIPLCDTPPQRNAGSLNTVKLTSEEQDLFNLLLRVVEEENLGTTLRVAGGWVRDKLLSADSHLNYGEKPIVDVDISVDNCSGMQFATAINRYLRHHGEHEASIGLIHCNPEKSKHLETACMKLRGFSMDFVNLRTEKYTSESRIPHVNIGTPEEDAHRRDITINALFYNIGSKCIEDFTCMGMDDLVSGMIRTPLLAMETLLDDPLRILRCIRFASRLKFSLASDLVEAAKDFRIHCALAKKVSRERIGTEVNLMVQGENPSLAFQFIHDLGLASIVFPLPSTNLTEKLGNSLVYLQIADNLSSRDVFSDIHAGFGKSCNSSGTVETSEQLIGDERISVAEQRRLILYAAFLWPFVTEKVSDNTAARKGAQRKEHDIIHFVMCNLLKLRTRDAQNVVKIQGAALQIQQLLRSSQKEGSCCGGDGNFVFPDRLEAGLLIRKAGSLWKCAVLLALSGDIGSKVLVADDEGGVLTSVSLQESKNMLQDESVAAKLDLYKHFVSALLYMGLERAWTIQPLLCGEKLQRVLPRLPKGAIFNRIMEEQIRLILQWPGLKKETMQSYLLEKYPEYSGNYKPL
eukprot:307151_1